MILIELGHHLLPLRLALVLRLNSSLNQLVFLVLVVHNFLGLRSVLFNNLLFGHGLNPHLPFPIEQHGLFFYFQLLVLQVSLPFLLLLKLFSFPLDFG
jgi:hypothetical protein